MNLFLNSVLGTMMRLYEYNMDAIQKVVLFRLMHLSLIAQHPDGPVFNEIQLGKMSEDQRINWFTHIRNMFHIVEKEIKGADRQLGRDPKNMVICRVFVQMAARACAAVSAVWTNSKFLFIVCTDINSVHSFKMLL